MYKEFIKYIEEQDLIKKGDRVLATVSGGVDSMVMADLLLETGSLSGIAHCNFCLRGSESDGDESMVKNYAAGIKIPFHTIRFDTNDYAKLNGISVEMAARELRYEWFEKLRTKYDYDLIAVAHNLNDNVETLILNLVRGTGIAGLAGMKPKAGRIIRPLLFATRQSIEQYAAARNIHFRTDSTNAETKFKRNKIRHELIPLMKELNPSVEKTINDTALRLSGINELTVPVISGIRKKILKEKGKHTHVVMKMLKPYWNNNAVMYELFKPYGITGSLLRDLENVARGRTGGLLITDTHRFLKNRDELIISLKESYPEGPYIVKSVSGLSKCPLIESSLVTTAEKCKRINPSGHEAYLDYSMITFPLVFRKWKPGDFFYPFGMKMRKKLSDYFIDRKLSRFQKDKAMVMETGGKIAWVVGERIDNRFRIDEKTQKILVIKAKAD